MAGAAATPEARVHALWLLRAYSALQASDVELATKDADPRIRAHALELSESLLGQSPQLAPRLTALAADPDTQVRFQAALTLGEWKDPRVLATLAEEAHRDSKDPWFRIAVLSSVGDAVDPFFHMVLAKGENWADPQLLIEASAMIGGRQNPAEIARWFAALPKLSQQEKYLDGLTRGLRLVRARNLQFPGADQAFARLLASNNEAVQRAAWESSRHFVLAGLMRQAQKDALSTNLPPARRVLAVRALRGGNFEAAAPVLETVLHSHPPPEVEASAVDALAAFDEPATGKMILDNWRGYGPDGRRRAVSAMLAQRNRIPLLLKAVEDGQVERSALDATARSHLYDDPDTAVSAKARALLENTGSNRAQVVASYLDVVNMKGDVARGKIIFQENCARCHEPRRQAGRIGPDLSGINNKTKEELITSILNPSYAIEPRFVNYVITTKDGRMYDGIIANETTWSITLRGGSEEGDETVLRKNIAAIRASSVSLMPDELEKGFGKQGLADVIAYLRGGL
jgi:putative heme-binding domain-containing protein